MDVVRLSWACGVKWLKFIRDAQQGNKRLPQRRAYDWVTTQNAQDARPHNPDRAVLPRVPPLDRIRGAIDGEVTLIENDDPPGTTTRSSALLRKLAIAHLERHFVTCLLPFSYDSLLKDAILSQLNPVNTHTSW